MTASSSASKAIKLSEVASGFGQVAPASISACLDSRKAIEEGVRVLCLFDTGICIAGESDGLNHSWASGNGPDQDIVFNSTVAH